MPMIRANFSSGGSWSSSWKKYFDSSLKIVHVTWSNTAACREQIEFEIEIIYIVDSPNWASFKIASPQPVISEKRRESFHFSFNKYKTKIFLLSVAGCCTKYLAIDRKIALPDWGGGGCSPPPLAGSFMKAVMNCADDDSNWIEQWSYKWPSRVVSTAGSWKEHCCECCATDHRVDACQWPSACN